eukprot:TRINITY_DN1411_c0_g1_i2.p1 TRINITY_DN1411_c0_g1~~TRINITY_DN1411_c0_g1_i2.p1  ORF type:complete len:302 (+),score=48.56 TRINITY_DN1411_c0_g1_i2:193-1098(+)
MGKSSQDKRDIYYRKAKEEGWRARSAFKLIQIDKQFDILNPQRVSRVVDLCAAPGSWSQVLARKLNKESNPDVKIVAVDLQEMAPLKGVIQIKGDITKLETANTIIDLFDGKKADLVVSDGAPDVTGLHNIDQFVQSGLLLAGLCITTHVLKPGGVFVAKMFRGPDVRLMYEQMRIFFPSVTIVKPQSSRDASIEHFILCQGYQPPKDYIPTMIDMIDQNYLKGKRKERGHEVSHKKPNDYILPFIACGDLSGFDEEQGGEAEGVENLADNVSIVDINSQKDPQKSRKKKKKKKKKKSTLR